METPQEIIQRYLQDAIAAEESFETQLRTMAKEGDDPQARTMFAEHADETHQQLQMLTTRLTALGGSTSSVKSFMAHMFGLTPKAAQLGHEDSERTTQNLMMAYAVENSEVAMYEALATAAAAAGDAATEQLARDIQMQEKRTADKVFALLPQVAHRSFVALAGSGARATAARPL